MDYANALRIMQDISQVQQRIALGWRTKTLTNHSLCCSSTTLPGSAGCAESARRLPRSTGWGLHGAFTRDHPFLSGAYGRYVTQATQRLLLEEAVRFDWKRDTFVTFQMSVLTSKSSVNTLFRRLNKFWESLYKNIFDNTLSLAV